MDIRIYNEDSHKYALELLKNDGVIVAPSVTNYGVFCSATSAKGIARIFEMKERTKFGPLTLGIGRPEDARIYADIPSEFSDALIAEMLLGMTTPIFFKSSTAISFPEQMTMVTDYTTSTTESNCGDRAKKTEKARLSLRIQHGKTKELPRVTIAPAL